MSKQYYLVSLPILITFLLFRYPIIKQLNSDFIVSGRVVTRLGEPVEGARIVLDMPPGADISYISRSTTDGSFILYDNYAASLRERQLYVTAPEPTDAFALIRSPFANTPSWFPLRNIGQKIPSKQNLKLDVGNIMIQMLYGKAKVYLRTKNGKPLITNKEAWLSVWLRVLDSQDEIIAETTVPKVKIDKVVDIPNSAITVALPEGTWKVEASLSIDKGMWMRSDENISIKAGESPRLVYLK